MFIKAILKSISIKNNDVDTYASIKFDIELKGIDLNELLNMKHKELKLNIEKK